MSFSVNLTSAVVAFACFAAFATVSQKSIIITLEASVSTIKDGSIMDLPIWDTIVAIESALQTRREAGAGFDLNKLFASIVGGLGGGTLACALVGLPPTWMRSAILLPLYAGVGTLVLIMPSMPKLRHTTGIFAAHIVSNWWAVLNDTTFMCAVVWGAGLPDSSPSIPTPSPVAAVAVAGLVASCGGGIVCDCLTLRRSAVGGSWAVRTPSVLISPSTYHMLAPILAIASRELLREGLSPQQVQLVVTAVVLVVVRTIVAFQARAADKPKAAQ